MTMLPEDIAAFDPPVGDAIELEPGLRRIIAPNPSPMTFRGTNTYLLGQRDLAVIDPGPDSAPHLEAILRAVRPEQKITHIIVSHSHLDHSPLARPLAQACGAPILAYGGAASGRSKVMSDLARAGLAGGGEGIDTGFEPDICLADGQEIKGTDWTLKVIHTPGHLGNHISLGWGTACFTADHVMGWASSLVSPPDGDLTDFMASCKRLLQQNWRVFYPGHGAPVDNPEGRLEWLIQHRLSRETAILEALTHGPATAEALAKRIYTETPPALLGAATRNVFAHLVDLTGRSEVFPLEDLSANAVFSRSPKR